MAKVPMISTLVLLMISRRSYSVRYSGECKCTASSDSDKECSRVWQCCGHGADDERNLFWMRHPKSGNWIPETHFDEIDVSELREKLLPKKKKP
ncbi:hypothetical protein I3760_01G208900 [Carya illinoinensis]|uniref:Uncharacterized protein n=1 Tax=Carya illinoinensis TaxID=32201 RepID=A0A8T1RQI8_CARIL|nr:hypothetical protein I3760_01G208900 [Carya illinoinensis]KAG6668996.1 hypothetical protein CIPAW_01G212100 [Carya illinoinensis]KAG6733149.1 hypothetical protein I3842_01G212300 [Carya illinoinensis]